VLQKVSCIIFDKTQSGVLETTNTYRADTSNSLVSVFPRQNVDVIVCPDSDIATLNDLIHSSASDYILIASSFIHFEGLSLETLIQRFKHFPDVGAVQPKVMSSSNERYFAQHGGAGGLIDTLRYHYIRGSVYGESTVDNAQFDKGVSKISWSDGTMICIRKTTFDAACGFDSALTFEEAMMDFSLRIQKLGYEIHLVSDTLVTLREESMPIESVELAIRSDIQLRIRMLLRHESRFLAPLLFLHLFFDGFRFVNYFVRLRFKSAIAIVRAYSFVLFSLPEWISERSKFEELSHNDVAKWYQHPFSIYWQHYGKLGTTASNALAIFLVIASVFSLTMRDRR
jgi:hypothetical protein